MSPSRLAWRQLRRGALLWAAALSVLVTVGISTYETSYRSATARAVFARSVGQLPALQALYGRAVGVDTVGGFLTWRYGDIMTVVVALWALLAVTRIQRGDEEAGRADPLLVGRLSPGGLLVRQLAVLVLACALVGAAVGLAATAGGLDAGRSLLFGVMIGSGGVLFGCLASFTSQLFDGRRRAAGWAGAVLGASYLVRALADGSRDLRFLGWWTPLGWTERIEPFTGPSAVPLVAIGAASATLTAAALALRARRDAGAGIIGDRRRVRAPRRITSVSRLVRTLSAGGLVGWGVGVFLELFVLGYLTKDMARFAVQNPSIDRLIRQAYGYSMTSPSGFLSLAFTVVALILAVYAGMHLVAARDEEASGRAEMLLAAGTSRAAWLGARIAVTLVAMAFLSAVAAVAAWSGARVGGQTFGMLDALAASYNVTPAALLFGGLTVAAFGIAPRATSAVAFGGATVAFLIQVIGGLSSAPSWLVNVSPFAHLAPVPARPVNVVATLVMTAIAVTGAVVGLAAFVRRDVASD